MPLSVSVCENASSVHVVVGLRGIESHVEFCESVQCVLMPRDMSIAFCIH